MENENPIINDKSLPRFEVEIEDGVLRNISRESIFQLLRGIKDPEHPYTLEQLNIITMDDIRILDLEDSGVICVSGQPIKTVEITFTPTVPHCSMAGIIGLCIVYQLTKYLKNSHITVKIKENAHNAYHALNKQLDDVDRVLAAFENEGLMEIIEDCTATSQ